MATPEELHKAVVRIGRSNPQGHRGASKYLKRLDYSVLQQCIHCGMCLPTCPTYDETKLERNSPRGCIALMRRVADGNLEVTQAFGQELYFCLGCLTCETVCPAGVRYGEMFEHARADIEQAGVYDVMVPHGFTKIPPTCSGILMKSVVVAKSIVAPEESTAQ